jgi:hypothetical protein
MMQSPSNRKIWVIVAVIFGIAMVLVIGYFLGKTFGAVDPSGDVPADIPGDVVDDSPRNPPTTGAVAIQTFTLEPGRIQAGECTVLSWTVTNAEIVTLSRDGEAIYNALMADSYQDCLDQPGIYRYRLDASNSDGQFFGWSELQVIVE